MRLLPAIERPSTPWRNGIGSTREIMAVGGYDFDWRLSIATVDGESDFSVLPGVDRLLMPLSPAGMTIVVEDEAVHLARRTVFAFPGENRIAALGSDSAIDDLNLMTRRGVVRGQISAATVRLSTSVDAGADQTVVLVVLEGRLAHHAGVLRDRDAVLIEAGESFVATGSADIAIARVTWLSPSRHPIG